ncbi:MAG TPA: alginate lyase family protein, partial [Pyrinomonadaceae bacterium]|nr:alginate lyase family protein [Pyrinomonadaceae bacterium]
KSLYLHARHLETYLSTYFSPNTHLTGEALGLFYLGQLLPEFRRASAWKSLGRDILLRELARHVRPDGVYFEQASYYHRYTTDFYTHLLILSRLNGDAVAYELEDRLTALLDHLMYIERPDGTTPLYGDDDGGRLLMIEDRAANDFRASLSTGAALFERADYKYVAGEEVAEETLWVLGPKGCETFDALEARTPAGTSRAFADSGYYLMRDGWSRDSNYLLMDGGPHGSLNYAHAHADALAFDLTSRGRTLLVDPGTYNYTGVTEMREHFRSSAAHNTLTLDGQSSSVPAGPFSWRQVAKISTHAWLSHERFDYFEASHDGYERLPSPAKHTRSMLFIKGAYWMMLDRVAATGAHLCELHFQFAPDATPVLESEEDGGMPVLRERAEGLPGLEIFLFGEGGAWREKQGWVSECYRQHRPAPALVFSREAAGAQEFVTFLVPHGAGENLKTRAREIEATGGRAFEVLGARTRDVLLISKGGMVLAARLATDFELAWARFSSETGTLEELLLLGASVGGRSLSLDGQEIFHTASRTSYLFARRVGERLRVETDEEKYDVRLTMGDVEMMT